MLLLFLFFDIFVQCTKKLSFFTLLKFMSFLPTLYPTFENARCNKQKLTLCTVWPYRFLLLLFWIQNDNNKKNETTMNESIPGDFYFISFSVLVWLQCLV